MFFTLLLLAAVFILSDLMRPKPKIENAKPGQLSFPTASRGRPVPLLWGTCLIKAPNVIWTGDFRQEPISQRVKSSLIFNKGKRQITGYKYYAGIQLGLCRGSTTAKLKQWRVNGKILFEGTLTDGQFVDINLPEFFGGDTLGAGGMVGRLRFHAGTAAQAVNAYVGQFQTLSGSVDPQSYAGTCHVVWEGGYLGNNPRIDAWEFEVEQIPNGLALANNGRVGQSDANLANVAYELYTNSEWGYDYDAADIDTANWVTAGNTLAAESNGFSMLLETRQRGDELIEEIERQMDGAIDLNHRTAKHQIALARGGYDVGTLQEINASNMIELRDFSRGTWVETSNVVRIKFDNRINYYTEDYAAAHDMANAIMQGAGSIPTASLVIADLVYPGIKLNETANNLAWRDLRTLSYPLAKATMAVTREFWDVMRYQVLAWTSVRHGFNKLPMRVQRVDYGELQRGSIVLDLVQDVFVSQEGAFSPPPGTGWTPPADNLAAFAANEQVAFPAPRGFVMRDEVPTLQDRVFAGGRRVGPAVTFLMRERHSSGTPSGAFAEAGEGFGFLYVGELQSTLNAGTAVPTTAIVVTPVPSLQGEIEAAFTDDPDIVDQGKNLVNLVMVGTELMLVRNASTTGANISLNNVYRGVLDTGHQRHAAGTRVFLLFVGGVLSDSVFQETHNVDIKLLPRSQSDVVDESAATTVAMAMDKRLRRPYPPGSTLTNGAGTINPTSNSLDHLASGAPETTGMRLTLNRRDYRLGNGANDELAALSVDAATLFADFPTANTTTHDTAVRNDPHGANTLLFTLTGASGRDVDILRIEILRWTDGVVPTRMRTEVLSKHNEGADTGLFSRYPMIYDFDTTSSALAGKFNFGARAQNAWSNVYTATQAGTYNFTLSSALPSGVVEYRLNGGSPVTLIPSGTTGSIVGVAVNDTIEVRHTNATGGLRRQLDMDSPSTGQDGYFIGYNA